MEQVGENSLEALRAQAAELSAQVIDTCRERGWTLATAESLTAGMLAARIADTPGASAVLRGGLVVYATDLKATLAGVDRELLHKRGPVDPAVAVQLSKGAAQRCGASIGIGLTGVAGPDGQDGHSVGEVHIGMTVPAGAGGTTVRTLDLGTRPRAVIRQLAVNGALEMILGIAGDGNK